MGASLNRQQRRKQNRQSLRLLYKLKNISIKVNKSHGWDKMFVCINQYNNKDILVLPYTGNESIKNCLGSDCVLTLPNNKRENNIICLVEYIDNICRINDGNMIYTC